MPIDSRIYFQQRTPDMAQQVLSGYQTGQQMADRRAEQMKQAQMQDAYNAGVIQGPNGQISFNPQRAAASLAGQGLGKEAIGLQQKYAKQQAQMEAAQFDKSLKEMKLTGQFLGSVKNQQGWDQAVNDLAELGVQGVERYKGTPYDPQLVESILYKTMTGEQQLAAQARDRGYDLKEQELDLKRQKLAQGGSEGRKEMQAQKEKFVPGIGQALTKQDAKDLKTAVISKSKFDRQIQELIDLREQFGGEVMNREAVARGKQLSKDLLLTYKNLAKLGVLSKSDEDIINAIIPADPLEFQFASIAGQDPVLNNLKSFKADLQADFENTVAARTEGSQGIAEMQRRKRQGQRPGGGLMNEAVASEKPQVIFQNGYEYRLNPQTGEYE